ncbi:hypothetical protein A5656_28805 [Mycobacterium gordonae]|nr:hypothetical protein A5656_28805 [Mycobacterium gordonae]
MARISPEMAQLRGRHTQRMGELYRAFLEENQSIDADLPEDSWTPEQAKMWWEFTAEETKRFAEERAALAERLRTEHRSESERGAPA